MGCLVEIVHIGSARLASSPDPHACSLHFGTQELGGESLVLRQYQRDRTERQQSFKDSM